MIRLPRIFILLWMLMLPVVGWCAGDASTGGGVSAEQTGSDGKSKQSTNGKSGATEEEPDCE